VSAVNPHDAAAVTTTSSLASTLATSPFIAFVFQLASTQVLNPQGYGEVVIGQHLTDQVFQALVRGIANPSDLPFKDGFDRVPVNRFAQLPAMLDGPESLNWDEVGTELDREGIDNLTSQVEWHNRHEVTISQRTPPTDQHAADRTALDQYFTQITDYPDQLTDEE